MHTFMDPKLASWISPSIVPFLEQPLSDETQIYGKKRRVQRSGAPACRGAEYCRPAPQERSRRQGLALLENFLPVMLLVVFGPANLVGNEIRPPPAPFRIFPLTLDCGHGRVVPDRLVPVQ